MPTLRRPSLRASATLLALALLPAATRADEPAPLEEVIVVGQRQAPITVSPRGLSVSLGAEQFQSVNASGVEDLMKYAPNFFVRKRYIGDLNGVPGFRGTHSTLSARTLVLLDGFLIANFLGNSFSFPPKWGLAGPQEVAQFDIVYGPYSSRHPGNALGGIVSIATRAPVGTELSGAVQGFAQTYDQYGTDTTYYGWSAEADLGWAAADSPWSLRLGARRLENQGQPMQFRQLVPATGSGAATPVTGGFVDPDLIAAGPVFAADSPDDTSQDQFRARLGYRFADGWQADALYVLWRGDSATTAPESYLRDAAGQPVLEGRVLLDGRPWLARTVTLGRQDRQEMLGGLKLEGPLGGWTLRANASRYWIDRQVARSSNGYLAGVRNGAGTVTRQGDTGWTALDLLAEGEAGPLEMALGGTGWWYETAQDITTTDRWRGGGSERFSTATAGRTDLLGGFVDLVLPVTPRLNLTGGARIDRWRAHDGRIGRATAAGPVFQSYADRTETALNPTVGASLALGPDTRLQLSLATATRFPTVGELFQGRLDGNGQFDPDSFDPDLKAEKSRDANLLIRQEIGTVRLTGSLFWQRVQDAIFSQQGFNQFGVITSSFKNIDVVRQWGLEGIVEAVDILPGLDLEANVAWIDAETLRNRPNPAAEGVRFPRIPRWRANGNLRWRFAPDWLLATGVRYASRPNSDLEGRMRGDAFGYTSEFLILDAKVSWELTGGARLSLGVDNLTNDRAWVFHPYPQRTYSAELSWRL